VKKELYFIVASAPKYTPFAEKSGSGDFIDDGNHNFSKNPLHPTFPKGERS
jgi:hypothetical protein